MPTELPYAADAEVSLSYDELEVRMPGLCIQANSASYPLNVPTGPAPAVPEGARAVARHDANEVQLCVGARQEPTA